MLFDRFAGGFDSLGRLPEVDRGAETEFLELRESLDRGLAGGRERGAGPPVVQGLFRLQRLRNPGGGREESEDGGEDEGGAQDRVCERTAFSWPARNFRSFARSFGSATARMATASRAAFTAPGFPMPSVPTGTPAGI